MFIVSVLVIVYLFMSKQGSMTSRLVISSFIPMAVVLLYAVRIVWKKYLLKHGNMLYSLNTFCSTRLNMESISSLVETCVNMGITVHECLEDRAGWAGNQFINRMGGYTVLTSSVRVISYSHLREEDWPR